MKPVSEPKTMGQNEKPSQIRALRNASSSFSRQDGDDSVKKAEEPGSQPNKEQHSARKMENRKWERDIVILKELAN